MVLADVFEALGLDAQDRDAHRLYRELSGRSPGAPDDWRMLAAALARRVAPGDGARLKADDQAWPSWRDVAPPLVLGIGGGQGAGKSTLARLLVQALESAGARALTCSIDDFYLSRRARVALARTVHPLLATRGVPGTHDVAALRRTILDLGESGDVHIPVFDKGADDVMPPDRWRQVAAPVDVLVLEGWCVGARPEPDVALGEAVNALEALEDADATWRRWVNDALEGPYAALWERIHVLVYLEVPDMAAVIRWRSEQERAVPPPSRMDESELGRFVSHYERITRMMQADLPARAHVVVKLNANHGMGAIRRNPGAFGPD